MTTPVVGTIFTIGLIAQGAVAANWWEPLVGSGPLGVILIYFMIFARKDSKEQTAATITNTLAVTAVILDSKHKDAAIAALAEQIKEQAEKQKQQNEKR